jgi:hypothetical protein
MISLRVRDYGGCERAEISCGPIALLAGKNAMGKSSIAQAVGAALCGQVLPGDTAKAHAASLVKDGAAIGFVELRSESGTARVEWPAAQATSQGDAPHASSWAAGVDSVVLLPAKERARVMSDYLHADPAREDLAEALRDAELGEDRIVEAVWKLISDKGWDGAHETRRELGAELKGRWRQITGANYGSRVAANWRPAGWSSDLAEANENDLAAAITRTKAAHEKAIADAAVAGVERQALEAAADALEELKDGLADAEIEETRLETLREKLQTARAVLPPGGADLVLPCPHCGKGLMIRDVKPGERRLEAAGEPVPADELKRRRLAIADSDGQISKVSSELATQARTVERARMAMQNAAEASGRLKDLPADAPAVDVAAAAAQYDEAVRRLALFRQQREAENINQRIVGNDRVLTILAPGGLRAKKLARVLDLFNSAQLAPLCAAAGWRAVTLDAEMTFAYGGRAYRRLSTSEQYRVRAVVQVAMAKLDGSNMVVLDAADVLDAFIRSGLFALLELLEESGLDALVCMTLTRKEQAPDLAASELGASYWIEDGIAQPLHAMQEAAA